LISKEAMMLTVTEKANEMISNFLKDREDPSYIRIYLSQGG
jgi:Fe-S cluster assembly iron-binding protein IscA